ncbi:hypothetical protein ACIPSA_47320 [Streptomyces sp. NPDC086549]|uniref:hypothetical protein n=1 Tax=Streptomyces sp. NPDC086549 TaxID=3365752 RepID=UPI0037F27731
MTDLKLLEETGGLRQPAYWSPFGDFARHDWTTLLLETLHSIAATPGSAPPMTPYADGEVRPALREDIHRPDLLTTTSLEDFLARWLGHERFFVTVSHLEAWNERLHDLAYESFVSPLTDSAGLSGLEGLVGGLDVYAVLGNCGATPFGVHTDDEPIFLMHCGPNPKEVWYSDLAPNGSGQAAATEWMDRATHHVMRNGDVVFIPAGTYHLLRSWGFGASLGFDIFPLDPAASADRRRALRSNGYLLSLPARPCAVDPEATEFAVPSGSRPEWRPEGDGKIAAFLRGRKVIFPDTPWMSEALQLLGTRKGFSRHELAAVTGGPEAAQQILSIALELGAIRPNEVAP